MLIAVYGPILVAAAETCRQEPLHAGCADFMAGPPLWFMLGLPLAMAAAIHLVFRWSNQREKKILRRMRDDKID